MNYLANENIPKGSITVLRNAGFQVVSISEESAGISDTKVLERAYQEKLYILTFDRDYGELIFKKTLPAPPGIIYFRFIPGTPEEAGLYLIDLLRLKELQWEGKLTIIERGRVRQRPFPGQE